VVIEWHGKTFEPGEPYASVSPYGLSATCQNVRRAVRFSDLRYLPDAIAALTKQLRAEVTEMGCEVSPNAGVRG
jgi:hypothetical protein